MKMNASRCVHTRSVWLAAASCFAFACSANAAQLIEKYGDWSLFVHDAAQKKICFAATQPAATAPKVEKRDPVFFYVSAWPKDGVKSEVSVLLGYKIKKGTDVSVNIGGTIFKLFPQDDKAFVADPTQELKLIDAMKRGSAMQVAATSEAGLATEDRFSLSGITNALKNLDTKCQ
ncbi:MAG: invasion associated locus B family protein [Hyphomicrobiaceae bacterium]